MDHGAWNISRHGRRILQGHSPAGSVPVTLSAMKKLGVIGGVGPESTIEYYRVIIAAYRERHQDGSYPPILINSINLKAVVDQMGANDLAGLADLLVGEIDALARAGAR